jgi:hypothetical protein
MPKDTEYEWLFYSFLRVYFKTEDVIEEKMNINKFQFYLNKIDFDIKIISLNFGYCCVAAFVIA